MNVASKPRGVRGRSLLPIVSLSLSLSQSLALSMSLAFLASLAIAPDAMAQEAAQTDATNEGADPDNISTDSATGVLDERERSQDETVENPYVFVAHKQNYVLPVSYTSGFNNAVYDVVDPDIIPFYQSEEVKFQLSLKVQLNDRDLFFTDDSIQAGFTLEAWWQLYSKDVSSPFRETNYQPEVFYTAPLKWRPFGLRPTALVGIEHQSNGRSQGLSRSWNRIYTGLLVEGDQFFGMIRPWYRIPEEEKPSPESPEGDDNPDILDFMGHGEVLLGWRGETLSFYTNIRGNPSTGKGAIVTSLSFPLFQRFRGVVQYFNGYGDALIDYDHFQQRIGVGILLSNLF